MQSITAGGIVRIASEPIPAAPAPKPSAAPPGRRLGKGLKTAPIQRDRCGTRAGWMAHQYHSEEPCEPCEPCAAAHREYHREYARTHRAKRGKR
jgi:hypothetical protein